MPGSAASRTRALSTTFPLFDPPQLRYLQTLNSISAENNSTIIFPVPVDIMASVMTARGFTVTTALDMKAFRLKF